MWLLFVVDLKRKTNDGKMSSTTALPSYVFAMFSGAVTMRLSSGLMWLFMIFYEAGASDGTNPDSNVFACYIQACDLFVLSWKNHQVLEHKLVKWRKGLETC